MRWILVFSSPSPLQLYREAVIQVNHSAVFDFSFDDGVTYRLFGPGEVSMKQARQIF